MLGCKSRRRQKLDLDRKFISVVLLFLVGCQTPPKPQTFEIDKPYTEVFKLTKNYIANCFPGINLRANLYTDIPEADIIVDHTPGATLIVSAYTAYSTVEKTRDVLNIHLKGEGTKTAVTCSAGNGQGLIMSAINKSPCPKIKK